MIYLSGRIDVTNFEHYRSQFEQAKEYLTKSVRLYQDHNVVSLFDILDEIRKTKPLDEFTMGDEIDMRLDVVAKCDKIYLLTGWELDDMCKVESIYAKSKEKQVIYSKKY